MKVVYILDDIDEEDHYKLEETDANIEAMIVALEGQYITRSDINLINYKIGLVDSSVEIILSKLLKNRNREEIIIVLSKKDYRLSVNSNNGSYYVYADEYITDYVLENINTILEQ